MTDATSLPPAEPGRLHYLTLLRHELRSPINGMLGYSQLLLEDLPRMDLPNAAGVEASLKAIELAAYQLTAQIEDVLHPAVPPDDLPAFIARASQICAPGLEQARAHLRRLMDEVEGGGLEVLATDLSHVDHSLMRLVELVEAMGSGEIDRLLPRVEGLELSIEAEALPWPDDRSAQGVLLVIDDQETNRDLLTRRLERWGYRVVAADGGREAIARLGTWPIDLILLDLIMPDMNGFQFLEAVQQSALLKDVPIIIVTTLDDAGSVSRALSLGAADWLPKPIDPVLLQLRVQSCMERRALREREETTLRSIAQLTSAVYALEQGQIDPPELRELASRPDVIGTLARSLANVIRQRLAPLVAPATASPPPAGSETTPPPE